MRIAIVSFAHPHAFSYLKKLIANPKVEWVGFYDDDQERVKRVVEEYNIENFDSIDALMEQNVDGVVIASENAKHKEHVCQIAPYKVSILCEKPLSTNTKDGMEMIKVCKENGSDLGVCYPVRYLSSVIEMKNKIENGIIGEIEHISASNHGSYPGLWFKEAELSGGGAIMDHTVHVSDIVYWMTGSKPKKVVAMANTMRDGLDVEDLGIVNVEWDKGFDMTLDSSWSRNDHFPTWGDVKFKIYGTNGVLEVDSMNQVIEIFSDNKDNAIWDYWGDDMDNGLITDFIESIENGEPFAISGEDGLVSLQVAELAYEHLENNK